jgi:hypothetical protein
VQGRAGVGVDGVRRARCSRCGAGPGRCDGRGAPHMLVQPDASIRRGSREMVARDAGYASSPAVTALGGSHGHMSVDRLV